MAFLSCGLLVGTQRGWPCLGKASPWVPAASDSGFILSRRGAQMLNKDLIQPGASSGGSSPHSHGVSSPGPRDSSSIASGQPLVSSCFRKQSWQPCSSALSPPSPVGHVLAPCRPAGLHWVLGLCVVFPWWQAHLCIECPPHAV